MTNQARPVQRNLQSDSRNVSALGGIPETKTEPKAEPKAPETKAPEAKQSPPPTESKEESEKTDTPGDQTSGQWLKFDIELCTVTCPRNVHGCTCESSL